MLYRSTEFQHPISNSAQTAIQVYCSQNFYLDNGWNLKIESFHFSNQKQQSYNIVDWASKANDIFLLRENEKKKQVVCERLVAINRLDRF